MKFKYILLFLSLFILSCNNINDYRLSLEEQVYESVFHYITNSTVKKVYIANTTDSYWFERNSIKDVQKYLQKSELAEIAGGQLESLYEKNSIPHTITWKPIMITSEFLPKEYVLNTGKGGKGYNCLVNINEGKRYSYK